MMSVMKYTENESLNEKVTLNTEHTYGHEEKKEKQRSESDHCRID